MPVESREIRIEAPRPQVWAALAAFGRLHEWAPAVAECEIISGATEGVGCMRQGRLAGPGRLFGKITERVTDWEEGTRLRYEAVGVVGPTQSMASTFVLEGDDAQGPTTVTFEVDFRSRWSVLAPVTDRAGRAFFRRNMPRSLAGLKQYVERRAAAG